MKWNAEGISTVFTLRSNSEGVAVYRLASVLKSGKTVKSQNHIK
jgi:hypothetical protein